MVGNKDMLYFETLEDNIQDYLVYVILPQFCLNATLEMKMANSFLVGYAHPMAACPLDSCTYCLGLHKTLFPSIIKLGVSTVCLHLFNGWNS